jgi:hypothetical protein
MLFVVEKATQTNGFLLNENSTIKHLQDMLPQKNLF